MDELSGGQPGQSPAHLHGGTSGMPRGLRVPGPTARTWLGSTSVSGAGSSPNKEALGTHVCGTKVPIHGALPGKLDLFPAGRLVFYL